MGDIEISNSYRSEIEQELSEITLLRMLAAVEQSVNRYNVFMRNEVANHDSYFKSTDLAELHQKEKDKATGQVRRTINRNNSLEINLIELKCFKFPKQIQEAYGCNDLSLSFQHRISNEIDNSFSTIKRLNNEKRERFIVRIKSMLRVLVVLIAVSFRLCHQ